MNIKNIVALTSHHTQSITEGFANMKELAHNNSYLREVLDEHRKGVRETIVGLNAQKNALRGLVEYLDEKRYIERDTEARVEAGRVIDEIKKIDKEIDRLTRDFA
jgi:hypothetical protein